MEDSKPVLKEVMEMRCLPSLSSTGVPSACQSQAMIQVKLVMCPRLQE